MKQCTHCRIEKPFTEFHRWNQRDGYQLWCKSCRKEYDREYHARNREHLIELAHRRSQRLVEWHKQLKSSTPCADCGGYFHPAAMHWDHLPGTEKLTEVSLLVRRNSPRRVREEIKKCELVCANCHAVRSYQRQTGRSSAW